MTSKCLFQDSNWHVHDITILDSPHKKNNSLLYTVQYVYYWNKVTVHHLKLCYFLMKKDNTMICGVLLNHCLTVNRIISKSVCLDTRLRDTSLKRCGVKSQFTNSVSCVSIIGVDASLTTTTHACGLLS